MTRQLFYLMTYLPTLPDKPWEPVAEEDALAKIRDELDESMLLLADLLEVESLITEVGMKYFVLEKKDFIPQLSERLSPEFREFFMLYREMTEAEWITKAYENWFSELAKLGRKTGSELLIRWARWEHALRALLRIERIKNQVNIQNDGQLPEFMTAGDFSIDHTEAIESWKNISDPLKAEKFLDQYRVDFLRSEGQNFSFSVEELVAYMLELRIHKRYERLSLDEGRKIIEEVTAL